MLNITKRIVLSKTSKRIVRKLRRKKKGLNSKSWDDISNFVKNEISTKLLNSHGVKCVYCERYFIGLKNEIDHLAHKGDYSQYSFITSNLFYACNYCNSMIKNQRNTIRGLPNLNYKLNDFEIVHPLFHIPDNEIVFKDADRVDFDWDNCTDIGRRTITFWKWDEFIFTKIRSETLNIQRLNPLTSIEETLLIKEIISYK